MGLDTSQVPKEIRDAEAKTKTAEGRFPRFAAYAVVGALSIPVGLIYVSAVVGVEATQELAEALVPFNNLYVGIGACRLASLLPTPCASASARSTHPALPPLPRRPRRRRAGYVLLAVAAGVEHAR